MSSTWFCIKTLLGGLKKKQTDIQTVPVILSPLYPTEADLVDLASMTRDCAKSLSEPL